MPINCSSRLPPNAKQAQQNSLREENYVNFPLASVAMASLQCFKNAEKTYYQQSDHGQHKGYAMSQSQNQCYGRSEKQVPMGHGHTAQAHGHHGEHAMAKTQTHCMGQNNGHHPGQHAQTHCVTQAHGHKKENSACHGKSKKKSEHKKKEIKIFKKKSRECKSGDSSSSSSSSSESESDHDRC